MRVLAVEIYKEAFELYMKNLLLMLVSVLLTYLLAVVFLLVGFLFYFMLVAGGAALLADARPLAMLAWLLGSLAFGAGTVLAVSAQGAFFGFARDAMEGSARWDSALRWERRMWLTFAEIAVAQLVIYFIIIMPAMLLAGSSISVLLIIMVPLLALASSVLQLAFSKAVTDFSGGMDSLAGGAMAALRNLRDFILLFIIGFGIALLGVVPLVGPFLSAPLNQTALLLFYRRTRERSQPVAKKVDEKVGSVAQGCG